MQFRSLTSLIVFLGSYFPLSLILLAQNAEYGRKSAALCWQLTRPTCDLPLRNPTFAVSMVLITLTCLLITVAALAMIKPNQDIVVIESKYIPTDLMNYTLPYIVSFMGIDYQDTGKFAGFVVFLGWMFWISHRSGQIILNPVLIALSWRLYEIKYTFPAGGNAHMGRALVRGELTSGSFKQAQLQDIQIIKP